jgi:hypothetical protein
MADIDAVLALKAAFGPTMLELVISGLSVAI